MAGGREPVHVAPDLGENRRRRYGADPRNRMHKLNQGAKGHVAGSHLRVYAGDPLINCLVDLSNRLIQAIPLAQMQLEQEAVVIRQPPMQRIVVPSASP